MKEFTDEELITMAFSEIKKMDIHLWSTIVISILMIIESSFLIFSLIPIWVFIIFWSLFMLLYLFHNNKAKKSEKKINKILNELTSRDT